MVDVSFSPFFPGAGAKKSAPPKKTSTGHQDYHQQAAGKVRRARLHLGHSYVLKAKSRIKRVLLSLSDGRLLSFAGWLDDIGLPQYKDQFNEARVDGQMLQYLTVVSGVHCRCSAAVEGGSLFPPPQTSLSSYPLRMTCCT